jgi:cellulose synthase/poly-beta-1,6-N-acetylglucosamine synthase-like glycosyltransferase
MVSLHVPAHNEPPDMVIDTLRALLRLDYPSYEVICIDDNTDDERLWRPVQEWCAVMASSSSTWRTGRDTSPGR